MKNREVLCHDEDAVKTIATREYSETGVSLSVQSVVTYGETADSQTERRVWIVRGIVSDGKRSPYEETIVYLWDRNEGYVRLEVKSGVLRVGEPPTL
jgi:hypothetical protein